MNSQEILPEIETTMEELIQLFSSFSQQQINVVPFEGSWTAAQVIKHVIMSCSGFSEMINGPVKDTERAPDEMAPSIKRDFLDFKNKMQSPDFIIPPDTTYKKEDLLAAAEGLRTAIKQAVNTLDLTKTCTSFELPVYGYLTRFEALNFILYHTQRHIHQLKKICTKVVTSIEKTY